ncbi:uncharacterized protein LOC113367716 [Ctenocephalides felis]|uniref:uncharacterized protein LOC113367716 n=1 Tax=Ctenocephalides felis TaxID=7515 RepID=UPI000E6E24FA|nr:uncharacterized protein LOC113367716 [Ctenocephalides felis]
MRDLIVLLNTDCNVLCSQQCSELLLQTLSSAIEIFDKSKKHDSSSDQMEMFETTDTSANNTVFQILNSCNDLSITEQGKCFCLCTIAHVAKQNSPLFDKAFGYLCDIKLDVQTLSLDFFIYSQIVKIFSNQLQLPRQCFDWIFGHLQRMCKSHFKNSEASFVILNLLKKLLPSVSALEAGSTKNNVVIMLSSFIIQCWKNNYGPWVTIELMDCRFLVLLVKNAKRDSSLLPHCSVLKKRFFSIRLEVAKCFSKLFDLQSRQISDHDKYLKLTDELFRDICATLKEDLAVSDSENELVSIDKRETKILTDLHVLAGIGAVNAKYRPRVMLFLLEMKVEKNIDTDILCDTINLIAQQLSITKHQLLQEYMPYILSNWKSDFSQFPKTILDIHSTKDFLQQCQHIMIGPVLSGNTLDAFCTKIGKDKETVAKANLVQIVTLLLIYQELEDSRIEAVSDVLSVAYDHDGKRLSSEIQNVCDEVVGELVGHVFDTSDYNKSFGKVEALPELQCPVLTREQVVRALDKVYKSKSSFMISICTENPSKLQTLLTSTVQKIYKSLSTQEKLLRFHHYTIFLDLINDELKTNSDLGNMEVYLIRDITHSLINLILNNEDYKIQQVVLKYLSKFTEVVLVEHSSIFGKYLKFVVGTMVSLCETRIEEDCLVYLKMLLVDQYVGLKVFIHHLDPLPTEPKFLELCRMLESLKGMPKDKSLRDELDFFIQTTNSKELKVHVELLRNLRKVLTANKKKMGVDFKRLADDARVFRRLRMQPRPQTYMLLTDFDMLQRQISMFGSIQMFRRTWTCGSDNNDPNQRIFLHQLQTNFTQHCLKRIDTTVNRYRYPSGPRYLKSLVQHFQIQGRFRMVEAAETTG